MQKILVSACLLGEAVRYDGGHRHQSGLLQHWRAEGRIVAFCPEVAAGLPTPRAPAEIDGGLADALWSGHARVRTNRGEDVTEAFIKGAHLALALCQKERIALAILKEGSPSCAVSRIGTGDFSGRKIEGRGVTASLLARHGIAVFSERMIEEAARCLREREERDACRRQCARG